jgi:hypothetical protein
MPDPLARPARALIRRYPKAWRERYELELLDYVDNGPVRWRDVADLARGCLVERARAFVEPEAHPTRAWMLYGIIRMIPAVTLTASAVVIGLGLRAVFGPLPDAAGYYALAASVPLLTAGVVMQVRSQRPWARGDKPLPSRALAIAFLVGVSAVLALVAWVDPPEWHQFWLLYAFPMVIRMGLDLCSPSSRDQMFTLLRTVAAREQLGWARMELARCESLVGQGVVSAELARARDEVARLERELASAVSAVREVAPALRQS